MSDDRGPRRQSFPLEGTSGRRRPAGADCRDERDRISGRLGQPHPRVRSCHERGVADQGKPAADHPGRFHVEDSLNGGAPFRCHGDSESRWEFRAGISDQLFASSGGDGARRPAVEKTGADGRRRRREYRRALPSDDTIRSRTVVVPDRSRRPVRQPCSRAPVRRSCESERTDRTAFLPPPTEARLPERAPSTRHNPRNGDPPESLREPVERWSRYRRRRRPDPR